jgi:murein DD-endopeptidase MepM/ murein hydrolase activator NlpD
MRKRVVSTSGATAGRLSSVVIVAGLTAACSADASRFGDTPFANPFATSARTAADPSATGSIKRAATSAAGQSSLGASAALPAPQATGTVAGRAGQAQAVAGSAAGWTAAGGTPVTLQPGETLNTLSDRYGVPAAALLSANKLKSASDAKPGQTLVIPILNPTASSQAVPATPLPAAPKQAATVLNADKARQRIVAAAPATPRPVAPTAPRVAALPGQAIASQPKATLAPARVALPAPQAPAARAEPVRAEAPKPIPAAQETTASIPRAEPAKTGPDFRWPARGRVISGFGKGSNGDGIAIAVPEGTPVKAAEQGVVAYAGSELKGYGNLVLIRHADGYVSAYAHNGEISVKRGETVKRGQQIARSGASGNVSSPQLHFELRKGSTPVDPTRYLDGQ